MILKEEKLAELLQNKAAFNLQESIKNPLDALHGVPVAVQTCVGWMQMDWETKTWLETDRREDLIDHPDIFNFWSNVGYREFFRHFCIVTYADPEHGLCGGYRISGHLRIGLNRAQWEEMGCPCDGRGFFFLDPQQMPEYKLEPVVWQNGRPLTVVHAEHGFAFMLPEQLLVADNLVTAQPQNRQNAQEKEDLHQMLRCCIGPTAQQPDSVSETALLAAFEAGMSIDELFDELIETAKKANLTPDRPQAQLCGCIGRYPLAALQTEDGLALQFIHGCGAVNFYPHSRRCNADVDLCAILKVPLVHNSLQWEFKRKIGEGSLPQPEAFKKGTRHLLDWLDPHLDALWHTGKYRFLAQALILMDLTPIRLDSSLNADLLCDEVLKTFLGARLHNADPAVIARFGQVLAYDRYRHQRQSLPALFDAFEKLWTSRTNWDAAACEDQLRGLTDILKMDCFCLPGLHKLPLDALNHLKARTNSLTAAQAMQTLYGDAHAWQKAEGCFAVHEGYPLVYKKDVELDDLVFHMVQSREEYLHACLWLGLPARMCCPNAGVLRPVIVAHKDQPRVPLAVAAPYDTRFEASPELYEQFSSIKKTNKKLRKQLSEYWDVVSANHPLCWS